MNRRLVLFALLAAAVVALLVSGLGEVLTLESLKARRDDLGAQVEARPAAMMAGFFLFYAAAAALSIPGAAILTLAGGAVFGLVRGVILVSFASVIGAVLAFLASRYLLRGWVERRFGRRLGAIDRGMRRDGIFYLLALRLNPAIPYFLVNLGMGLTRMPVLKFALVSQAGMLPATIVYVNAGTQLARIEELGDIASPQLIGSLLLLSLFPLAGKWAADRLRRRRLYRKWNKPRRFDRNLVVIGAGAGGLVTAYIAAATRAKVSLIEQGEMGGDCLNTGCVPSKTLIRCARTAHEMRTSARFGIAPVEPKVDFAAVMAQVDAAIAEIAPNDSVERYRALGVDVRTGHARIVDPWTVEVAGERITTRAIVLATGGAPAVPEIRGIETSGYLTSDTMWEALRGREAPPRRLVIIGGGPIGAELAQAFARLGSRVTLVQHGERILEKEDEEAAAIVAGTLRGEGVNILAGYEAVRCDARTLTVRSREEALQLAYDELIVAVGRRPRLSGYGLEELGIDTSGRLETNAWLETLFPNIYAVGDVAGPYLFTHAASHQAWHAAVNALFGGVKRFKVDYSVLPRVTFTEPELAHVGHGEASAAEAGIAYRVVRFDLGRLDRAVAEGTEEGFVKLLVPPGGDRILGATIVGHNAGEIIAVAALAMKQKIGLKRLLATVHAYPTMAEGLKMAAGEWRRATAPEGALRWAERWHRWRRG